MPLLFSYGTRQRDDIQLSAFGRLLHGQEDLLVGYEPSLVEITDVEMAAKLSKTHHANVTAAEEGSSAAGTVFEVTDAELASCDVYEALFDYVRVTAPLAPGRETWLYVHAPTAPRPGQ